MNDSTTSQSTTMEGEAKTNGNVKTLKTDSSETLGVTDKTSFSSVRLSKSHNLPEHSSVMSRAKSEEFLNETKYVMLNFMSLIPPRLYKDHVHSSPVPIMPASVSHDKFSKSLSHLSKSKSFDVAAASRLQRQNHLNRLHMLEREVGSPASEDNVNYRYKQYQTAGLTQTEGTPDKPEAGLDFDQSDAIPKSQSAHSVDGVSSSDASPRKTPRSVYRLNSDTSSCGDYSYYSDADDEYEGSHSSSMFSAASHDGFLDLRRSSNFPKHSVARSVSELDESDALKHSCSETIPECQDEDADNEKEETGLSYIVPVSGGSNLDHGDGLDESDGMPFSGSATGDRTKLKLNIPPQPVMLDDVLLSLQSELNSELTEMESEYDEVIKSAREASQPHPCMTPTQAAKILARIGDEVKEEYSSQISSTVSQLLFHRVSEISYQQFKDISNVMLDKKLPGWRQVALLMVYGQSAAWYAVQGGHKNISSIVDHCSRLVFDVAAEFIIKEGGWGAVMNFDPSQSSDTQSSTDFESPVLDYFTSHNVTQVESGTTVTSDSNEGISTFSLDNNDMETSHSIPSLDLDTKHQVEHAEQDGTTTHLNVHTAGLHTYKPSLGFDFRTKSTASTLEGSLKRNPNSDQSIDYVINGDDDDNSATDDDRKTIDSENIEEEVFVLVEDTKKGRVESENGKDTESAVDEAFEDRVDGMIETVVIDTDITQEREVRPSDIIPNRPGSHFINLAAMIRHSSGDDQIENSDQGDKAFEPGLESNASLEHVMNQLPTENELEYQNQDGEEMEQLQEDSKKATEDSSEEPEELEEPESQTAEDNQVGNESLLGHLGGARTKVMLFAGVAAAVGLGLKFGFFNR